GADRAGGDRGRDARRRVSRCARAARPRRRCRQRQRLPEGVGDGNRAAGAGCGAGSRGRRARAAAAVDAGRGKNRSQRDVPAVAPLVDLRRIERNPALAHRQPRARAARRPKEGFVSEERRLIAQSAADLLDGLGGLGRARRVRDAWPLFDWPAWREMAGAGWPGSLVPEEQGGAGLRLDESCALLEAAGGRLAPEPLAPCIAAGLVLARSAAPQAASLLQGLLAGERVVVPAAPAHPAWPGESRIDAVRTAAGIRLNGCAPRIPDSHGASDFLLGVEVEGEFVVLH